MERIAKMSLPRKIHETEYNGYRIWGNQNNPCRVDILQRGMELIEYMGRTKFLFIRFDLHFPKGYTGNDHGEKVSEFTELMTKRFNKLKIKSKYLWACEWNHGASNPHYHFILLLDGNRTKSIHNHAVMIEGCWGEVLSVINAFPVMCFCVGEYENGYLKNGFMYRPGDQRAYAEAVRWMSYLAKTDTKQFSTPERKIRKYGSSRLPSNFTPQTMGT